MLFADLVETSLTVASTRSRLAKRDALAALLTGAEPADIEIVVAYLAGELRQRRTGVGWASLRDLPVPAAEPSLTLAEIDAELQRISELSGTGSARQRSDSIAGLFARATAAEQKLLRGLISGEIRQGALDSSMLDAIAAASGLPLPDIRRAVMLRGATGPVAVAALVDGTVAHFTLTVGRPVRPMLASTAPDTDGALAKIAGMASIDSKARRNPDPGPQGRRRGPPLHPQSRRHHRPAPGGRGNRARPAGGAGHPWTVRCWPSMPRAGRDRSRRRRRATASQSEPAVPASVFFFDVLAVDDEILIDHPLRARLARLDAIVAPANRVERLVTAEPREAAGFFAAAVAGGQEGVVVKDLSAPYEAGRRGAGWIKVKPRHTLDLVVLAVEWGSGRRQGLLSNIHLGARDPENNGWVMLGKTFKGMTDEMLAWQTRTVHRAGHRAGRPRRPGPSGAGRRDRLRRSPALDALPRRPGPAIRPGTALPRRQAGGRGRHHRPGPNPLRGPVRYCRRSRHLG